MINFLSDVIWENGEKIPYESDPLSFLYSLLVVTGVLTVIFVSAFKLYKRGIPLKDFMNGIYISLPVGIIGASIFGKLGSSGDQWKLYMLVFFWEPGMSFFGSMLCGGTAAFLWLWHKSRQSRISIYVYADCIVPNILLGQSIGRWGNLFNHEILGREVHDLNKINWLPNFIWHRLFYFKDLSASSELDTLQFREPLFLYESFATLFLWLLITFVFANLWKIISKKPWKIDPENFPCKANKTFKSISEENLKIYNTQTTIEYLKDKEGKLYLSNSWVWKKAYTLYEPSKDLTQKAQFKIDQRKTLAIKAQEKYVALIRKNNEEIQKQKSKLEKSKITKQEFNNYRIQLKKDSRSELKKLKFEKNRFISFLKSDSKELYEINNPNSYKIIHSGVLAGIYIVGYTMIRVILDQLRNPYELTVKNNVVLNSLFLTGFLILGLSIIIFAQFIAPKKWREEGWLYEKSY
ncbi:prolipoprotein diacylglyceryl transferase [Spiroplasma cantharicola]|uniref:Prolipoprotein diacylglyceryl transferase n=2 Tax=Spiroplasma cantharicola TaxID=362837 RepID=A0A0M4JVW8_9MOLU|nr:prolipoprotein diacylglyceryl transferase [Spiroplasma cantharicola]